MVERARSQVKGELLLAKWILQWSYQAADFSCFVLTFIFRQCYRQSLHDCIILVECRSRKFPADPERAVSKLELRYAVGMSMFDVASSSPKILLLCYSGCSSCSGIFHVRSACSLWTMKLEA